MSIMGSNFSLPGVIHSVLTTFTNQFWWGEAPGKGYYLTAGKINSGALDAGNNPTSSLRPGLLLGVITAAGADYGEWKEWNPAGADGSEVIRGILGAYGLTTLNINGVAEDKFVGLIAVNGNIQSQRIIVPGSANPSIIGNVNEPMIRAQMREMFKLDDQYMNLGAAGGAANQVTVSGNTAVTAAMSGKTFIAAGGAPITFTLPLAAQVGVQFTFVNTVNFNMIVAAGTPDTLTVFNDPTADSVAFQTVGELIGGVFRVTGINNGAGVAANSRWLVENLSKNTMTVVT